MIDFLTKIFIKNSEDVTNTEVRGKYGLFASIIVIILNVLLFVGKFVVGIISMSATIQADAFNNLSDAGSSIVTLVGFKLANKPVDADHPFGHGRIEYLSGFIVSMLIILVGVELVQSSVQKIINQDFSANFSLIAFVILAVSMLVKVWIFFFMNKIGKKIDSEALKATAIDSRSDVIATGVVLVSAIITRFTGWLFIDAYMGGIVGLFIILSGLKSAKETVDLLLGQAPDKEFSKEIINFLESYPNVVGAHDLVVHNYGVGRQMITVHAEIPNTMNIDVAHELVDGIESDMKKKYNCHVVIHMDPVVVGNRELDELKLKVREIVKSIDQTFDIHDFVMTNGQKRSNLIFDLVRTDNSKITDEQIIDFVRTEVKKINKGYEVVIKVEQAYV